MAGVMNLCRHCKMTVYDGDTTLSNCPDCHEPDWLDWPRRKPATEPEVPGDTQFIRNLRGKSNGYRLTEIPQGAAGELSKVLEEVHECLDAEKQDNRIMVLAELADVYGAIELYLAKNHPMFQMADLAKMADATHRAFTSGRRKRK